VTHLKVYCENHLRNFCKKICASYLRKFYTTHLQVEQGKLQVKSGISWALLCCECRFNNNNNVQPMIMKLWSITWFWLA